MMSPRSWWTNTRQRALRGTSTCALFRMISEMGRRLSGWRPFSFLRPPLPASSGTSFGLLRIGKLIPYNLFQRRTKGDARIKGACSMFAHGAAPCCMVSRGGI